MWTSLRLREKVVVVGAMASLVLLVVWPVLIPRSSARQVEFAWELYAKGAPDQRFTVSSPAGSVEYRLADLVEIPVAEVRYEELLPDWLCTRFPEAESVQVVFADRTWLEAC